MKRDWTSYFQKLLTWTGASSVVAAAAAPGAVASLAPDPSTVQDNTARGPAPLIFERPHTNSVPERFAGHSSHASHASHSSHYSGSGGGYSSAPAPYYNYTPPPAAPRSTPAVPALTGTQNKMVMVLRVQSKLHDLGYYTGTIDGAFGTSTQDALRRYQLVKGFPATGRMDDSTLVSLGITY